MTLSAQYVIFLVLFPGTVLEQKNPPVGGLDRYFSRDKLFLMGRDRFAQHGALKFLNLAERERMPIFDLFELLKSIPTFQRHFLFFSGSDAPWEGGGRPPSEMSPARPPDSGATLAAQERALAVLEEERDIARRSVSRFVISHGLSRTRRGK